MLLLFNYGRYRIVGVTLGLLAGVYGCVKLLLQRLWGRCYQTITGDEAPLLPHCYGAVTYACWWCARFVFMYYAVVSGIEVWH